MLSVWEKIKLDPYFIPCWQLVLDQLKAQVLKAKQKIMEDNPQSLYVWSGKAHLKSEKSHKIKKNTEKFSYIKIYLTK